MHFHVSVGGNWAVWAKLDWVIFDDSGHMHDWLSEIKNLRCRSKWHTWNVNLSSLVGTRHNCPSKFKASFKLHIPWISFLVVNRRKWLFRNIVDLVSHGTWHVREDLLLGDAFILIKRWAFSGWMRQLNLLILLICYLNQMSFIRNWHFKCLTLSEILKLLLDSLTAPVCLLV